MMNENDEVLFSQLADGELPSDQANELLLHVLDAPVEREKLKTMLRFRHATVSRRTMQPPKPVVVVSERPQFFLRGRIARRLSGLAVAACVGGLLVLTGVWAAGWLGSPVWPAHQWQVASGPDAPPVMARVSLEQMQQVAKVFAMHESVAGPLAWYAADDQNIKLASARGTEASSRPIAVLLRIAPVSPGGAVRTYVIVCREGEASAIELPTDSGQAPGMKVYLTPQSVNGSIEMQYAIATPVQHGQPAAAAMSGQRTIGLTETQLGQLAMGDGLLNIQAAAWRMPKESK